jgi:hypothetical protein
VKLVSLTLLSLSPTPPGGGGLCVPGPPFLTQSFQLPGYSPTFVYPACLAMPAAALLRTPALQKKIISLPMGGFAKPNWSWNSAGERSRASGEEVMGRLMAVGMLSVPNSWGSRTSIRRRASEGFSRTERTWRVLVRAKPAENLEPVKHPACCATVSGVGVDVHLRTRRFCRGHLVARRCISFVSFGW